MRKKNQRKSPIFTQNLQKSLNISLKIKNNFHNFEELSKISKLIFSQKIQKTYNQCYFFGVFSAIPPSDSPKSRVIPKIWFSLTKILLS